LADGVPFWYNSLAEVLPIATRGGRSNPPPLHLLARESSDAGRPIPPTPLGDTRMPTSDPHNIGPLLTLLLNLKPRSILDVGCGWGKYGVLVRENTDIWEERLERESWQVRIEGIEAYERYRNPIHDYVYNKVHYGDARALLAGLADFDVVLIADVIEHLEAADARALVAECLKHAPVTIVSTPREFYAQHAICDNDYERHRCVFTAADFPAGTHVRTVRVVACDIFVGSREPLPDEAFTLTEPADFVYLWSRRKLGKAGLPVSVALRGLCRLLG
jgi:hypothetical protein